MGKIVLVDDDEVAGIGAKTVLNRVGFDAIETSWKNLPSRATMFGHVDVLIAVVRRDPASWDRYRSLHSVGDLRAHVPAGTRIVAVAEPVEAADPLLGLRLHRAGVGDVLTMRHVQSVERIATLAAGEMVGRDACPHPGALSSMFVGRRSDPAQVLDLITRLGQRDPSYLRAFTPGLAQSHSGLTRRRAHTLRCKIAKIGDLSPDPSRRTGGPVRDESIPRWSQVVPFVNQIRGWRPDDDVIDLSDERGTSGPMPSMRPVFHQVG
ncbi:MAG: hypothetical protein ABI239_02890 [Aquihabitans sp.]